MVWCGVWCVVCLRAQTGLEYLSQLSEVRLLDVSHGVGPFAGDFRGVGGLRRLTHLDLSYAELNEADVRAVAQLTQLQLLRLKGLSVPPMLVCIHAPPAHVHVMWCSVAQRLACRSGVWAHSSSSGVFSVWFCELCVDLIARGASQAAVRS